MIADPSKENKSCYFNAPLDNQNLSIRSTHENEKQHRWIDSYDYLLFKAVFLCMPLVHIQPKKTNLPKISNSKNIYKLKQ